MSGYDFKSSPTKPNAFNAGNDIFVAFKESTPFRHFFAVVCSDNLFGAGLTCCFSNAASPCRKGKFSLLFGIDFRGSRAYSVLGLPLLRAGLRFILCLLCAFYGSSFALSA